MRWSPTGGHSRPRGLPQNVRLLLPLHGAGGPPLGRRIGFGTENSNEGAGINRVIARFLRHVTTIFNHLRELSGGGVERGAPLGHSVDHIS